MTVTENLAESISLLEKALDTKDPHFVLRANFKILDARDEMRKIEKPVKVEKVNVRVRRKVEKVKVSDSLRIPETPVESKEISALRAKLERAESEHLAARAAFKKSKHMKTGLHSERATELYAASLNRLKRLRQLALDNGILSR